MKNNSRLSLLFLFTILIMAPSLKAQSTVVSWTGVHQTMDGWGGEDWIANENAFMLNASQADMFFSPTAGIGLEVIETQNFACPETGSCAVSTSNVPDLITLQEAIARGAKVWLHVQPPGQYQSGGNFWTGTLSSDGSGSCVASANLSAFANYTVEWIQMLQSNGVSVSYLSVANEPETSPDSLGACNWTAAGIDNYVANDLGPALTDAGLSSIQVDIADSAHWFGASGYHDYISTCLNDANCSKYVSVIGTHSYGLGSLDGTNTGYCCETATVPPSATAGKKIWMSEVNGGFSYNSTLALWNWDPSMADAMVWAHSIHDFLTVGNVSAYIYWEIADCCGGTSHLNDGLTDSQFNTSKRYYAIGQWSKFVRPGWARIDATANPANGIYVTAFKEDSSGNFAVVAVNQNSASVNVEFSLTGFPSANSVTPTVTSASASLEDQANVNISNDTFSYALPGTSITTFHGTASASASGASKAPTSPTNLAATVN
jgi:glucuronoarabinoxylan endo-1,4-beta-xylanase